MRRSFFDMFKLSSVDSPVHRLDARTKMLFTIVIIFISLAFGEIIPHLILLFVIIPIVIAAKMTHSWLRTMKFLSFFIVLLIVIDSFLIPGPHATNFGVAMALRLVVLTAVFGIFFSTTDPDRLALALRKLHFPFEFCWAISTAFRFIPTVAMEGEKIIDAQKARGLELEKGGLIQRTKKLLPILVPLFTNSIRRAHNMAEAMESRGWKATKERTSLTDEKYRAIDYFITVILLMITFLLMVHLFFVEFPLPSWFDWKIPQKYEIKNHIDISLPLIS